MAAESPIDVDLVERLARILTEHGLGELDVEQDGARVRLAKPAPAPAPVMVQAAAPMSAAPAAVAAPTPVSAADAIASHPGLVTSPMVGTVYVAAEPGAKPFVAVGDSVREGQTVLIIEAMKVMNQIPAPRAGRVTSILISDKQPVEFGQPLLIVE